ncbi:MAG TPA: hypothetical protein VK272_03845 [Solirubrobacteraceae bacterium]|nr:hypothetical protein [Solirubrobacteraceae bacterium]
MLASIIVALAILGALGYALKTGRSGDMITHRPYNNRYSDAAGARDHALFE